jgi:erythromycin esterase
MNTESLIKEVQEKSVDIGQEESQYRFDFLQDQLKDKRFVFIGESSHCVKQYSMAKIQLIKFLHAQLGFNVLAFESELGDCSIGDYLRKELTPLKFMEGSIGRVWHNDYNLELFKYMKDTEEGTSLHLSGLDVQQSAGKHFIPFVESYLSSSVKQLLIEFERLTNYLLEYEGFFKKRKLKQSVSELDSLGTHLLKEVQGQKHQDKTVQHIIVRSIENRLAYCKANVQQSFFRQFELRDQMMADNLQFLAEKIYPHEKFIIWAHNMHIRKNSKDSLLSPYKSILENLKDSVKNESFVMALYAHNGEMSDQMGNAYSIKKSTRKHMEWLLNHAPYQNSFMSSQLEWGEHKWRVYEGGGLRQSLVPARQYDGLLFFKNVSPAFPKHEKVP